MRGSDDATSGNSLGRERHTFAQGKGDPYVPSLHCSMLWVPALHRAREHASSGEERALEHKVRMHACQTLPVPLRARKARAPTRNGMRQILLNLAKPIYHLHWRPRSTRKEAARAIANIKQTYVAYSLGIHLIRCFS